MRKTLIRSQVGQVRAQSDHIPVSSGHAFGMALPRDEHDASSVVSGGWAEGVKSKQKRNRKDLVEMNKRALVGGAKNMKDFKEYHRTHAVRRKNPISSNKVQQEIQSLRSSDEAFGRKSALSNASVSKLIGGSYTNFDNEGPYPNINSQDREKKSGKVPKPRPTKASLGQQKGHLATTTAQNASSTWKMKKFQNIKSTYTN